jgi:hypothetical protein
MVGYALGARMTQELTAQALWRAVRSKRPMPGLTLHSDGSQYCKVRRMRPRANLALYGNLSARVVRKHQILFCADAIALFLQFLDNYAVGLWT